MSEGKRRVIKDKEKLLNRIHCFIHFNEGFDYLDLKDQLEMISMYKELKEEIKIRKKEYESNI